MYLYNLLTKEKISISMEMYNNLLKRTNKTNKFKRRSRLYIPLIRPEFFKKIPLIPADGFIFDLEDSVPSDLKQKARDNIINIPEKKPGVEHILRINDFSTDFWKKDIKCLELYDFDSVMIPKVKSKSQMAFILDQIDKKHKLNKIILIEDISSINNVKEILALLKEGDAIGYGAGDISMLLDVERISINKSPILQYTLTQILLAAKLNNIDVFDPPYRDFKDLIALEEEAEYCHGIFGTTGKQAIHPTQVDIINRIYSPSKEVINKYIEEASAFENNKERQALNINNSYKGKPSKLTAYKKLIGFLNRGYLELIAN